MKIVLAVDGSEYSEGAARFLSRLPLSGKDEIMVLHVINFTPFLNEIDTYTDTIYQLKQEIAPRILDSTLEILSATRAVLSTAVVEGEVDRAIMDAALDAGAGLIVTGAKGLQGIRSFIVGSVTRSIALNSPLPHLVIKRAQWESAGKTKILFATDGSSFADAAGRLIGAMPFPPDTEITVMNVVRSAVHDIPERFFIEVDDRMKDEVARIRTIEFAASEKVIESAKSLLGGRYDRVEGLTKVGDPSIEIINTAEHLGTDIIVVGCRGVRGTKGRLGTVARNVLRHAKCSYLIGKVC